MENFGQKLKALRYEKKLTLKELANLLGYDSHSYISELESGKKSPSIEIVIALSNFFRVTTDQLLKDEMSIRGNTLVEKTVVDHRQGDLPFVDRLPTDKEVEKLRLLLSTYQDGSGGIKVGSKKNKKISSLPNFRDFERCVATAFGGEATETKEIFDVILKADDKTRYGISCKMKGDDAWKNLTDTPEKYGYIHIELSNAAGAFKDALSRQNITLDNYTNHSNPYQAGRAVINLVKKWHRLESKANGGSIDLSKSFFLSMIYDTSSTRCSLFLLPLKLPNPRFLEWYCPMKKKNGSEVKCNRIQGDLSGFKVFDYYGNSGGQLKYYYLLSWPVLWSVSFTLEEIPSHLLTKDSASRKAEIYFEEFWKNCASDS